MTTRLLAIAVSAVAVSIASAAVSHFCDKNVKPFFRAAKKWEKKFGETISPDIDVVSTYNDHYIKTDNGYIHLILTNSPIDMKVTPNWVKDGASEILIQKDYPERISQQAMFAAKYIMVKHKLAEDVQQEIIALGTAYFDNQYTTLPDDLKKQVKLALISRLNNA